MDYKSILFSATWMSVCLAAKLDLPLSTDAPEQVETCIFNGMEGECVAEYLCDAENKIITDGAGVLGLKFGSARECSKSTEICCFVDKKRTPDESPLLKPLSYDCGWRNPNGVGAITAGGKEGETKFAEFPWMCAIVKLEPVNEEEFDGQKIPVFVGGGSLIHPSVVLTVAHYVYNIKQLYNLRVRAGEWDTQSVEELYPYQDRTVQSIVVHQDFNPKNLFYDIGLIFLTEPMDLAPNVQIACLPPKKLETPAGTRCFGTGWGKNNFGKQENYQVVLKKVEVPVVDKTTCRNQLRKTRLGRHFQLHTSFMCAGGEPGVDTCKGDGGSPLSCPIEGDPGRYMQSGIVSWGIGCGENNTPGVYVDVGVLRDWIDDKVIGQGYDPRSYTNILY